MSRIDRIFARKTEAPRPVRNSQKFRPDTISAWTSTVHDRPVYDSLTSKTEWKRPPHHFTGMPWWRERFADLVERRVVVARPNGHSEVSYTPREHESVPKAVAAPKKAPRMVPRPEGMTRQAHRLLYRQLCKANGLPWRKSGTAEE